MPLSLHCYFLCVSSPFSQIASTVGFVFSVAGKSSRKWTMRCFDGVVTVVDADNDAHGESSSLFWYFWLYIKKADLLFTSNKSALAAFSIFWQIPFPLAIILFRLSLLQGGEYLTFEEIILLLTLMGSCIYATISLTLKFVEFLLKNKEDRWLSAMSAAIIIVPQILRQLLKTATQNKLCGCLWCTIGDSNPGPTD